MVRSSISWVYVAIQAACLLFLLLTGPLFAGAPHLFLELLGLFIGMWALWTAGLRQLTVFPEALARTRIAQTGPYRLIRHPMYFSVLLVTLALLVDAFSPTRLVVWITLLADLIAKVRYEEAHLRERFPDYRDYQRRTKALIPFLY